MRLLAAGLALLATAYAPALVFAGPSLVFDVRSGEVYQSYMAATPWHPASLTKLMTAYVAFRAIADGRVRLDTQVTIGPGHLAPSPGVDLSPGTTFSLQEALEIILVGSVNAVAEAIAETVSGSVGAFVDEMNATARRLGMADTVFANPHGLHDPSHVTTARDLALLTVALARDFPEHQRLFAIREMRLGQKELVNHNGLLGAFTGADGMKTGYVCASGFNLVATATRGERRLGAVVLGAKSEAEREAAAARLLATAFADEGRGAIIQLEVMPGSVPGARPVDMRPFVCGKTRMPADLASFGLDSYVPLPRARP